jgi:hypothetical protein
MGRLKTSSCLDVTGQPFLSALSSSRIDFYREEFVKLQRFLDGQRECFSEHAISEAECALMQVMASLDEVCGRQDADLLVSALLEKFGVVARLAAWSDSRPVH